MKKIINQVSGKLKKIKDIRDNYQKKQTATKPALAPKIPKKDPKEAIELHIRTDNILKILTVITLFLLALGLMYQLRSILIMTVIALFLCIALSPILTTLESYRVPRPLAISLLYLGFFGIMGLMVTTVIPIVIEQLLEITRDLRNVLTNNPVEQDTWLHLRLREANFDPAQFQTLLSENITNLANQLRGFAGSTIGLVGDVFTGIFNVIFTLVLMFFILLEREKVGQFVMNFLPKKEQTYWTLRFGKVQQKIGDWFRGQLILMFSLGAFMYVGMKIFEITLDMKYAFTIALVTAVMSLFPYIGVFITGLLCVLIAINISWVLVIAVLVWIGISQVLEGNFLSPIIMEKTTGLSPVVVLLALSGAAVLGSALGGIGLAIMAMIFAVPVSASIAIFVDEYLHRGQ